ncbi:zinc finger protein 423 [Bicyclus anynana]|uniref:Zinc finger protein 423 n=1 Tax=Bicyclus anynana TaxID=110368 RepID=A0ABM3M3B2_BICAN|nr:zinc finger protein 423 [Bicyclus anynana]
MEDEEDFVGCISCMSTNDLCDLFETYANNEETFAQMLKTCFDIKVTNDHKYICANCVEKLENSLSFKTQTLKNMDMLQDLKDEEYLDETMLEEADNPSRANLRKVMDAGIKEDLKYEEDEEEHEIEALDESQFTECHLCGASLGNLEDHLNRCHSTTDKDSRDYACHFCDNVYNSKKACFTHLRMKHGLKLCNDHIPKYSSQDRKKCHLCSRDFSQKQILNNHLWKAHGFEVEKRKAFFCPLCSDRVSYGANFSAHLLQRHHVTEEVQQLEFDTMDDFMLYKSEIQEETKFRFRKTTASKQTIEGIRSHYMCSQSGIYVYQGKGKRLAPERQIYKTGKACPAHMIVTETLDKVHVTFYMTHVGHGTCPYYEPRVPKRKTPAPSTSVSEVGESVSEQQLVCDTCGLTLPADRLQAHVAAHGRELIKCEYCSQMFQNVDEWTHHLRVNHEVGTLYN